MAKGAHRSGHDITHVESTKVSELLQSNAAELKNASRRCCSLGKLAKQDEKRAESSTFAARRIAFLQRRDDWLRATSVCVECGGKALYFIAGNKYCRKHLDIGKALNAKKWTPRSNG